MIGGVSPTLVGGGINAQMCRQDWRISRTRIEKRRAAWQRWLGIYPVPIPLSLMTVLCPIWDIKLSSASSDSNGD